MKSYYNYSNYNKKHIHTRIRKASAYNKVIRAVIKLKCALIKHNFCAILNCDH